MQPPLEDRADARQPDRLQLPEPAGVTRQLDDAARLERAEEIAGRIRVEHVRVPEA